MRSAALRRRPASVHIRHTHEVCKLATGLAPQTIVDSHGYNNTTTPQQVLRPTERPADNFGRPNALPTSYRQHPSPLSAARARGLRASDDFSSLIVSRLGTQFCAHVSLQACRPHCTCQSFGCWHLSVNLRAVYLLNVAHTFCTVTTWVEILSPLLVPMSLFFLSSAQPPPSPLFQKKRTGEVLHS